MPTCSFRSPLAFRLQSFLDMRCAGGRSSETYRKPLTYIDRFLMGELKPGETITEDIINRWIEDMKRLSVGTRLNRISVMKQFCLYLSHFDPRTTIMHRIFLPRRTRPAPHIYTYQEVCSLMDAANKIGPPGSLRPLVISTLIGLLYTTGLRISEALKLTVADIDLKRRVLVIRLTKFKKSRYVPIDQSTARHLRMFLGERARAGFSTKANAPVFVNTMGSAYSPQGICAIFLKVARSIGIRGPKGVRGPRLHDFRHTFAVNRLTKWYDEGSNLGAKLPLLSTYLGHTTVTSTQVYLHATAELLEKAGKLFHSNFAVPATDRKETPHVKKY